MAYILLKKPKKKDYNLSDIKTLGHQLLSSRGHINNLPILLQFINPSSPPQFALESLLSLQSFFTPLLPDLPPPSSKLSITTAQKDPEFIFRTWVRSKFDDLVLSLISIVISEQCDGNLGEVVLDAIMDFVKVGNGGGFHSSKYHKLLHRIVYSKVAVGDVILDLLASKYFKYIDVRYFTYISLEKLARTLEEDHSSESNIINLDASSGNQLEASLAFSIHKIHHLLSRIPPLEGPHEKSEYEMLNGSGVFTKAGKQERSKTLKAKDKPQMAHNSGENVLSSFIIAKRMKLKFSKAWISFLRLPLPLDVYKEVLASLYQAVVPYLCNPLILCDFLTQSYDIGGVISVMSLSGLYVLMTQHGLDYPNFYEKLYALLEPSIFMAKYRANFFQLLDSCLKSPLLPAYFAAAFTKKLSRLAVSVPPSGALVIIALIHNLLRRHPSINFLVHKDDGGATVKDDTGEGEKTLGVLEDSSSNIHMDEKKPGTDHFDDEESNPVKTNAMRSSLWEIDTLRHHYCPPVSRFVTSLENDLTIRAKTTEVNVKDFSSASYATVFREEIGRRVKQVPLAFYKATPASLFSEADFTGWTFKFNGDEESNNLKPEECNENSAKRQRVECS